MKTNAAISEVCNSPIQFEMVESGIYRKTANGVYYERPSLNGRRTWRSLKTKNLKHARETLHKNRTESKDGQNFQIELKTLTVGDILRRYQNDGFPDKHLGKRSARSIENETYHCGNLLKFWDVILFREVNDTICDKYADWRKKRVTQGTGERMVDRELTTLNSAFRYAKRRAMISFNPLIDRPRYQTAKMVRHCREFMPGSADELHQFAGKLMESPHSVVLGFQQLFEAMTGLRTCEVLKWRTDAGPDDPGYVTPDGKSLRVWRCKGQHAVNPYVKVHDGSKALLEAHQKWKQENYPDSPFYFPSPRGVDGVVDKHALAHALLRLNRKHGFKKVTSHGMRAFYVTVRRSHGSTDPQIAFEIGHSSGGVTLAAVYGGVPPHWMDGEGPKMSFLPTNVKPAWEAINSLPTEPQHPAQNNGAPAACPPPASTACNGVSPEPVRPATKPNGAQLYPPTTKPSGRPLCVIAKCSYPESPVTLN
jgi:integrase